METNVVPLTQAVIDSPAMKKRVELRLMSADDFVEKHGSGTLRKAKRIGLVWRPQYLEERVAYEFGWGFRALPRSRVTFGDGIAEQDSPSITEACWHIERYTEMSCFPEDYFEPKMILIEQSDGKRTEGLGIIVRQTSANFVPGGHVVFAIIAEFDLLLKKWHPASNPF